MGCRGVEDKADLERFVAHDGALTPDPEGRRPGRGAYLHRDPRCWEQAVRRRAFARALRVPVAVPEAPSFAQPERLG